MDEEVIDLESVPWTSGKEAVPASYKDTWDHADTSVVPRLFHAGFTFRASLGPEFIGYEQTDQRSALDLPDDARVGHGQVVGDHLGAVAELRTV